MWIDRWSLGCVPFLLLTDIKEKHWRTRNNDNLLEVVHKVCDFCRCTIAQGHIGLGCWSQMQEDVLSDQRKPLASIACETPVNVYRFLLVSSRLHLWYLCFLEHTSTCNHLISPCPFFEAYFARSGEMFWSCPRCVWDVCEARRPRLQARDPKRSSRQWNTQALFCYVLPRDATTKGPSSKQAELFFFQQVVIVLDSKTRTEVEHAGFKVVYRWMGAKSWFYMVLWSSHIDGTSFCSVPVLVCCRGCKAWKCPEDFQRTIYINFSNCVEDTLKTRKKTLL